jgi:hypothetical protein
MMDALLCTECKRVEQKPWKDDCYWSKYNSCTYCRCTGDYVVWLRTDEQKKEALIAEFKEFCESAKRVMEFVAIAFPERRATKQHEDGTKTEVEVSLDAFSTEDMLESVLAELKTLTRKVGE